MKKLANEIDELFLMMVDPQYHSGSAPGYTSQDFGHTHGFEIDIDGNGRTISVEGEGGTHEHKIEKWVVMEIEDHDHELVQSKGREE